MSDTTQRIRVDSGVVEFNRFITDVLIAGKVYEDPSVPGVIYTTDGDTWRPAVKDPIRFEYGTNSSNNTQTACWTGDRFIMYVEPGDESHSFFAQSFDGVNWDWVPDASGVTIPDLNGGEYNVFEIKANGQGLVVALSSDFQGALFSNDFGATWRLVQEELFFTNFDHIAVAGSTVLLSPGSSYCYITRDNGQTFDFFYLPPQLQTRFVTWIEFVNGAWWFSFDDYDLGRVIDGLVWKTSDFVNWERIQIPWDFDYQPAIDYAQAENDFAAGYITRFCVADDGVSVLAVGFASSSPVPDGQLLWTPDAGVTWKIILSTDWGPNVEGTSLEPHVLAVLSDLESDIDLGDTQGLAFFFNRWWVSNNSSSMGINTPVVLSASADLTEWRYIRFENSLIGDGNNHLTMPVAPIVGGSV